MTDMDKEKLRLWMTARLGMTESIETAMNGLVEALDAGVFDGPEKAVRPKEGWVYYSGQIPEEIFRVISLRKDFDAVRGMLEGNSISSNPVPDFAPGRMMECNGTTVLSVRSENGISSRALVNYDRACNLTKILKQESTWPRDYHGMPMLPDTPSSKDFMDNFRGTEYQDERDMMYCSTVNQFFEALRHMRVLLDTLYGKDGWKQFW